MLACTDDTDATQLGAEPTQGILGLYIQPIRHIWLAEHISNPDVACNHQFEIDFGLLVIYCAFAPHQLYVLRPPVKGTPPYPDSSIRVTYCMWFPHLHTPAQGQHRVSTGSAQGRNRASTVSARGHKVGTGSAQGQHGVSTGSALHAVAVCHDTRPLSQHQGMLGLYIKGIHLVWHSPQVTVTPPFKHFPFFPLRVDIVSPLSRYNKSKCCSSYQPPSYLQRSLRGIRGAPLVTTPLVTCSGRCVSF